MRYPLIFLLLVQLSFVADTSFAAQNIHVFVALCDNVNQGIVPVPEKLGNGQDPRNNLYWGALYGCKTYFKRDQSWEYLGELATADPFVLERVVFKHRSSGALMLVDAYDGSRIRECTEDFLLASNGQFCEAVVLPDGKTVSFGGCSNLVAYVGHDGLMEFDVALDFAEAPEPALDVIILACASKPYFQREIKAAGANPVLWTTNLMAPEAYVLDGSLEAWISGQTGAEIRLAAAAAYHEYQKCGINGAKRLFATGFGE